MNHKLIKLAHAEITKRYLEGKTLEEFGNAIGRNLQEVSHWKNARQSPPAVLLYRLSLSDTAADWVRKWAGECLNVWLQEE